MAIDERLLTMPAQWAAGAQPHIPTPPVPGIAYRNTDLSTADLEAGQAYDKVYDSARYNQRDYLATGLIMQAERYGILPWSSLTDYPENGVCLGLDGTLYQAVQASGPGHGGAQPTGNAEYWKNAIPTTSGYELCEFYFFRHPTLRPGFQPAQGGLLEDAASLYPEAWAYLQTVEGQRLCKTESEWQALTRATWATLADGTKVGWNGIGGAPYYVQDLNANTLRLPDLRGMYAEAAGFDSLGVGGVHGDAIRNITGMQGGHNSYCWAVQTAGAHYLAGPRGGQPDIVTSNANYAQCGFDASRVVPVDAKNQPRAWGALACVYLGTPGS